MALDELNSEENNLDEDSKEVEEEAKDLKELDDFEEELIEEEIQLGGTPAGIATNEALRSLSRVARSFLIYDSRNEAIRGFLKEYKRTMDFALKEYGEMILEIRPFEMVRGAEIVYLERERSRSLAFRLFRDGVRRISIAPDVEWEELLRLLEVLSIRFTGIRQQEDDIVTLLLKSGFKHIEITAVEGFVPDDEEYCGDDASARTARQSRSSRRAESHIDVPPDWDLPLPESLEPVQLRYKTILAKDLDGFQEEGSSKALSTDTVRLLVEMLKVVGDPTDPTTSNDIDTLIQEARDFLLAETQLNAVLELVFRVEDLIKDKREQNKILLSFTNENAIRRIIASLPKNVYEAPPELKKLLDISPINHLPVFMDILQIEKRKNSRQLIRELIGIYLKGDTQKVLDRLPGFEGSLVVDLIQAVYDVKPEMIIKIIESISKRTEPKILYGVIRLVEQELKTDENLSEGIEGYLESILLKADSADIRSRVLNILVRRENRAIFPLLEKMVLESKTMTTEEAISFGEAMAKAHSRRGRAAFLEWLRPQKWYSLHRIGLSRNQRWAGIAGVSLLTGFDVVSLIKQVKEEADAQLSDFCIKMLVRRRRLGLDKEEGEIE